MDPDRGPLVLKLRLSCRAWILKKRSGGPICVSISRCPFGAPNPLPWFLPSEETVARRKSHPEVFAAFDRLAALTVSVSVDLLRSWEVGQSSGSSVPETGMGVADAEIRL